MVKLSINDQTHDCLETETVLDALLRAEVKIAYVCKKGTCHTCMLRSLDVPPPNQAQSGLKSTLKSQNYFLACLCHPQQDMQIKIPNHAEMYTQARIISKTFLNHNTLCLSIRVTPEFEFHAGQYVNLQRPDGLTRSYSIANIPDASHTLELHIRLLPNGRFSSWLQQDLQVGDDIAVSEAQGHCFYLPERSAQGVLLVGTGTGLAPLLGILTDALKQQHSGPIYLFHGSHSLQDLYHIDKLRQLVAQFTNLHYTPCISGAPAPEGFATGRAHEVALSTLPNLKNWRVYLCGHPEMVNQMKMQCFLKGAASGDIYADAFLAAPD